MNRASLISVGKGALIALAGALLTYLAQLPVGDFGPYGPMVAAALAVVVNAGRKWVTSVSMFALLALFAMNPAFAAAAPPRLAEAGPPTIKSETRAHALVESSVYISVDLGGGRTAGGTGTVIAAENRKTLVLTNAHVVPSAAHPITVTYWCDRKPWTSPATYIGGSSVDNVGPNQIRVNGPDLAILAIEAELPAVEIADTIPATGEAVSLYGFGGSGSTVHPTLKTGRVLRQDNWQTTAGDPIARTSIETVNGDSGSGIFNEQGQLVAVHWGGGAVRLDTVTTFIVAKLRGPGLFPKLQAKLAARKISKAIAAAFAEPATKPPAVKQPAAPLSEPCPGGVCTSPSRGFRRR